MACGFSLRGGGGGGRDSTPEHWDCDNLSYPPKLWLHLELQGVQAWAVMMDYSSSDAPGSDPASTLPQWFESWLRPHMHPKMHVQRVVYMTKPDVQGTLLD